MYNSGTLNNTGEILLNNISENLQFQNDLFIIIIGFFIIFFALILSFKGLNYLSNSYFFNKLYLGKK